MSEPSNSDQFPPLSEKEQAKQAHMIAFPRSVREFEFSAPGCEGSESRQTPKVIESRPKHENRE